MKKVFAYLFVLLFVNSYAQIESEHIHYLSDPDAAERNHSVDIIHMKVQVSFEPKNEKVIGEVTHTFKTIQNHIDTLFFDGPGINVREAYLDDEPVPFKIDSAGVTVVFKKALNWDETHNIRFKYTAFPKKGIYFIGWNQPENKGAADINYIRKQIWTQGQGVDNRFWIPMYDCMNDKFTTETVVTMENPYKVLSNGQKISQTDNGNNTSTWHYKLDKPHAGYLLMLGIGNYAVKETKTKRGTPVQFWYYPEFTDRLELTSLYTEKMIELLEDETGTPYPWGSYSQIMVQNFLYGAMENTSATVFGDFFTVDARGFKDRNYMGVNCHELTHQWFGDLITARSGNDVWLQESFATFYPKMFFKEMNGDDDYQWAVRGEFNSALAQGQKDNFPVRHTKGGTTRLYPKGSSVLSMLRYQIGDDNFKRFIQYYLAENQFKNVEAWDFQKALKNKLGMNYDWFFDQWIHRGGEPHFEVSYTQEGSNLKMTVKQIHKTNGHVRCFKAPVDIAVYTKDGKKQVFNKMIEDTNYQVFTLPLTNKDVQFVVFDEKGKILKKLTFKKGNAELFAQAEKSEFMIDRYDAILALKSVPFAEKAELLMKRFDAEKHHGIRAEIASQLANQNTESALAFYKKVIADSKSEVKSAFIASDSLVSQHLGLYKMLMADSSNVVAEAALDRIMKATDINKDVKVLLLSVLENTPGQNNNIRAKWLEYAIRYEYKGKSGVKANTKTLVMLAGPMYEFRTRNNAASAIERLNLLDADVVNNLFDAILSYNYRLSGPCKDVLNKLCKDSNNIKTYNKVLAKMSPEKKALLKQKGIDML